MFKPYNFENNVKVTVIIFSFIIRMKNLITYLFQKLIYEHKIICIISNSHVDVNYVA